MHHTKIERKTLQLTLKNFEITTLYETVVITHTLQMLHAAASTKK